MTRLFTIPGTLLLSCLLLAGCGGGGSGGSSSSSGGPVMRTGVFIDGPVQGLSYETATQSGLTSADGEFTYLEGETVTFSIGDIELGSAPGAAEINPFDLFNMTPPTDELELRLELNTRKDVTDFDRAANVAFLLVSLDNDSDPDNGIDLTGWNAALTGAELDFNANLYEFAAGFRRFAGAHGINPNITPMQSLAHLYNSLGITVQVHLGLSVVTDVGDDGAPNSVLTYAYDAMGLLNSFAVDSDADGHYNQLQSYVYTSQGRMAEESLILDSNDDGISDRIESRTFTYDSNGDLANYVNEIDNDGNGALEVLDIKHDKTNVYDEFGKLISSLLEIDIDVDDIVDQTIEYIYTYDENGNLLSELENQDADLNGDPDTVITRTFTYDVAGNRLTASEETDIGNDGVESSENETSTYDASGNLLTFTKTADYDEDGADDDCTTTTYTYDSDGNKLTETIEHGCGGVVPPRVRRSDSLNSDRTLVVSQLYEVDNDGDGEFDNYSSDTAYTYSSWGNWLQQLAEVDSNGDGTVDTVNRTTHNYTTLNDGVDGMFALLFQYSDLRP